MKMVNTMKMVSNWLINSFYKNIKLDIWGCFGRENPTYHISSVLRRMIFLPKQSQRSRSILKDGSRSLGLFRMGKIGIIANFHRTDLVI